MDAERRLALSYVDGSRKPALETLWRLDATLGQILSSKIQPIAAQLRLAWWRSALQSLDEHSSPPEPLLLDVQERLLCRHVSGGDLAGLVDGWEQLLASESLSAGDLAAYSAARGATLFRLSARLLSNEADAKVEAAGASWALTDLARHSSNSAEAATALAEAARQITAVPDSWQPALRPLGMLAVLAARDVAKGVSGMEKSASPARMLRMLAHRLTGR